MTSSVSTIQPRGLTTVFKYDINNTNYNNNYIGAQVCVFRRAVSGRGSGSDVATLSRDVVEAPVDTSHRVFRSSRYTFELEKKQRATGGKSLSSTPGRSPETNIDHLDAPST
jgi:hypothetical protein